MEDRIAGHSPAETIAAVAAPVAWRDLRDWLDLVEANGLLKHIAAPVEPDEELGAITLLATRREDAPALLFEQLAGDRSRARVLCQHARRQQGTLRARRRHRSRIFRSPSMIAATRAIMNAAHRAGPRRQARCAGERDRADRRRDRPHRFSGPEVLARRRRPLYRHRRHHADRHPPTPAASMSACYRQMLHGPARVGLYCSPGKHGLLDREGWWARGKPCEVVAAYGIDPVLFMLGAQVFGAEESELDVAGGMMGRRIELTDAEFVSLPIPAHAEFVIEGLLHPGDVAAGRPARRVHRILRTRAFAAAGHRGEGGASSAVADLHRRADGEVSVLRDRRLLRHHALGAHSRRPRADRRAGRGRRPTRIPRRRRAGASWWCRCSSNMPATPRRCWRSPRNARPRPTTPNGSSRWTTTSIRPT